LSLHLQIESELQKKLLVLQSGDGVTKAGSDNGSDCMDVEECKARIAQLRQAEKDAEDAGPLYDCLVFHDGERWQVS
jgi:hypothetical protein